MYETYRAAAKRKAPPGARMLTHVGSATLRAEDHDDQEALAFLYRLATYGLLGFALAVAREELKDVSWLYDASGARPSDDEVNAALDAVRARLGVTEGAG